MSQKNKIRKLIDLNTIIVDRLTEQAQSNNMPVKNYIEYICNIQAFNQPIKTIQSNTGIETDI